MNTLVVHHTYAHGLTFDVSNFRNHGVPTAVTPGSGDFASSFEFTGGDSRINVEPAPSLRDLGAVRAQVRFFHRPTAPGARRHNLMEGFLSFALVVNADGSLGGGIVDASGNWTGVGSPRGIVTANEWHVAEFRHDGLDQCELYLDGARVAVAGGVVGSVRSVAAPYGLAIGHWPDPPDAYTFEGYIGEVRLWKHEPVREIHDLLDPCCTDREALGTLADRLLQDGWDRERLQERARELLDLIRQIVIAARAADPDHRELMQQAAVQGVTAFLRRDHDGFVAAWRRLAEHGEHALTPNQLQEFRNQVEQQLARLPLPSDELLALAERLCWSHGLIRDDELANR